MKPWVASRLDALSVAVRRPGHVKVPEVTVYFWVTKVLTTAMGESTSDGLVHQLGPDIAVPLAGLGLAASLVLQFRTKRYVPWVYWLAAVMVAIFLVWHRFERTLSIHSITTPRREAFYWAVVMATFALGTAAGDMTAATLGLGYFASGLLFTLLIALPALAYRLLGLNAVVAFWTAYILTRPLGASFADWFAVPHWRGGLGLGAGLVSGPTGGPATTLRLT